MRKKFINHLFWLVIAAAFIGPGTVTTAASAGSNFQYQLIWVLVFSILACFVLQEAAARITIVSGLSLGQALMNRTKRKSWVWFIALSILLGCLAYEAGNILGAISGLVLITVGLPAWVFVLVIGLFTFPLLFFGRTKRVGQVMGIVVAAMGVAFIIAAFSEAMPWSELLKGTFIPTLPDGSLTLALGMLGTTIVPYNLFLGASLAEGQRLNDMRKGLGTSILVGGLISIAILLTGAKITGDFDFAKLYGYLVQSNSETMAGLFAFGLFAAGITSTITAALAGALTIKSVHPQGHTWDHRHKQYRAIWMIILILGLTLGLTEVRPVPVIILAQAANGMILPLLTAGIWKVAADRKMMTAYVNNSGFNLAMSVTFLITSFLGLLNILKASNSAFQLNIVLGTTVFMVLALISIFLLFWLWKSIKKN